MVILGVVVDLILCIILSFVFFSSCSVESPRKYTEAYNGKITTKPEAQETLQLKYENPFRLTTKSRATGRIKMIKSENGFHNSYSI